MTAGTVLLVAALLSLCVARAAADCPSAAAALNSQARGSDESIATIGNQSSVATVIETTTTEQVIMP